MEGKQGKVPALVYNVPGAAKQWHWVQWDDSGAAYHPDFPIARPNAEKYVKAHQARIAQAKKDWDRFEADMEKKGHRQHGREPWPDPPLPVKLVWVTEKEAQEGLEAYKASIAAANRHEPAAGGED